MKRSGTLARWFGLQTTNKTTLIFLRHRITAAGMEIFMLDRRTVVAHDARALGEEKGSVVQEDLFWASCSSRESRR